MPPLSRFVGCPRCAGGATPVEPSIKRKTAAQPATEIDYNGERWDTVKEAIRIALDVEVFNTKGFSKNFRCLNPQHEDKTPSAAWHKDGFYKCFGCGELLNAKEMAERLGIERRALVRPQPNIVSSQGIDLNAAPQMDAETAPLSIEHAPDSWLRTFNKFYTRTEAVLFFYVLRAPRSDCLAQSFTTQEFIEALRELGCKASDRSIYRVFEAVSEHDNHPLIAKLDPSQGSRCRNAKYRLRSLEDIKRRLLHDISLRVYENTFHKHPDILIGFEIFAEALPGSNLAIGLKSTLEPLYSEQKQRFERLKHICEQKIAAYGADLDDLSATPLSPDWTVNKPSELPTLLARGIYDADPEDRSKAEWAQLLGISSSSVDATLKRAGIERGAYTEREEVSSQREAKDRARELGAKIVGVEVDGSYMPMGVPKLVDLAFSNSSPAPPAISMAGIPELAPFWWTVILSNRQRVHTVPG